jgi:hypothetical protein
VASYLHDSEAGFLLRKDTIVNRVCFPTKLGEYLASGCWVVSSNIDWDVKDYFNTYRIGLLIDPQWDYLKQAETILQFRNAAQKDPPVNKIRECTARLDRSFCTKQLSDEIHFI